MMRLPIVLVCATLIGAATAQEVRLTDGRVLVGETSKVSDGLRVATREGLVTVSPDDVVRVRARKELRAELRRLSKVHGDAPHASLGLARIARGWGLTADMWRHLDACLEQCPDTGAVRRRLEAFLRELEADILPEHVRTADVDKRVRELVRRVRGERDARARAVEQILAQLDGAEPAIRAQARRAGSPLMRLTALRALGDRQEPGADRFVYRSAILDSSEDVRQGAMQTDVARRNSPYVVSYLAPGLLSQDDRVRVRTAEAFANLGDASAIVELAHAGPAAIAAAQSLPGGSSRAYMAVVNQQSYIRDFDVEVAQAAFIADPKIDVIQSGVVLDVTVHSVQTVRTRVIPAYRRALTELAGSDPGADPRQWPDWLASLDLGRSACRPGPSGQGQPATPGPRSTASAGDDDDDEDEAGTVWAALPSSGAVAGSPSGGPPAVGSPQPGAGINVNSIGASQPGQPVLPGRR